MVTCLPAAGLPPHGGGHASGGQGEEAEEDGPEVGAELPGVGPQDGRGALVACWAFFNFLNLSRRSELDTFGIFEFFH